MVDLLQRYWIIIVSGVIILIFAFFIKEYKSVHDEDNFYEEFINGTFDDEDIIQEEINATIIIDIKGEVKKPGVYEVDKDLRVNDVILLAGGLTDQADEFAINLAQKLQDEMVIHVPKIGEETEGSIAVTNGKIKINYATQEEIETLNGIGPAKAQAIIQYREENGFFNTIEDLLNVSGIGEKTLENIKDDIQVP